MGLGYLASLVMPQFDGHKATARLSIQSLWALVIPAAEISSSFKQLLQDEIDKVNALHASKVIDFARHSKTDWYALNVEYTKSSGSRQYDRAGNAFHTV